MGAGASSSPGVGKTVRHKAEKLFKLFCRKHEESFVREDIENFLVEKCGVDIDQAKTQSIALISSAHIQNGAVTLPMFVALCERVGNKVCDVVLDYVLAACEKKRFKQMDSTTCQTVVTFLQMLSSTRSLHGRTGTKRLANIKGLMATKSARNGSTSLQKKLAIMFSEAQQMLDDFEKANPSQNLCRKGNVLGEPMVIDVNDQACDNCGCELIFQETLVQSSGENPKKTYICAACISRWKAQETPAARQVFIGTNPDEARGLKDAEAMVFAVCRFLLRVLRHAHLSKPLKIMARMLFSSEHFKDKLVYFDALTMLRNGIQLLLAEDCAKLKNLYDEQYLSHHLGTYKPPVVVGHTRRQDFLLPHPPGFDWMEQNQEEIYIHFLRLIAFAIDIPFQRKVAACVKPYVDDKPFHRSGIRSIKSFPQMLRNMVSPARYRLASKPRPDRPTVPIRVYISVGTHDSRITIFAAMEHDINRCLVVTKNWGGVQSIMKVLLENFGGGFVNADNQMSWSDVEAAKKQHVRVMTVSVEFDTGKTFNDLCADPQAQARFKQYSDHKPPATVSGVRWKSQVETALECIRSSELADEPVRMVCEVKCMLSAYRDLRFKMHELRKMYHAIDQEAPCHSFENIRRSIQETLQSVDDGRTKNMKLCRDDKAKLLSRCIKRKKELEDMGELIKVACRHGSIDSLKLLLKLHGSRAAVSSDMYKMAELVIRERSKPVNRLQAMEMLLHAKVHVDTAVNGVTPLWMAAEVGHVGIVRLLVKAKAKVNASRAGTRITGLYMAAKRGASDIVLCLLKAKANVNAARTDDGTTSLYVAAKAGHFDAVRYLVKFKASINLTRSVDGTTGLYRAASSGYFDVACHLVRAKANIDMPKTGTGITPMWIAANNGHSSVVRFLVKANAALDAKRKGTNTTVLAAAARNGHTRTVRLLVKAKADVCARDVLYEASKGGHTAVVSVLVEAKAELETSRVDPLTRSSLWIAASNGHVDVVHYLLEAKANVNSNVINTGSSCLWIAASKGHIKVVRILVRAKAHVNEARPQDKTTPLYVASQGGHLETVRFLISLKANVNTTRSDNGTTGLWMAACKGHAEIVRVLAEAKAAVDAARINDGITGCWIAAQDGHVDVVRFLAKVKANLNVARHHDRTTALHMAAFGGNLELVRTLCSAKASIHVTSNYGTALTISARANHKNIVTYLQRKKKKKRKKKRRKRSPQSKIHMK